MSQSPVMEDNLQEQFRLSRFRRGVNEAAMFVENNIVLSRQKSPVYAEQLDQFVSVEEGIKQQQIRYTSPPIKCGLILTSEALICGKLRRPKRRSFLILWSKYKPSSVRRAKDSTNRLI
jgi:hypothetical protein